ncbi:MAG: hypothetical protein KDD02_20950 [Phaeodactylibacter sp.]|nr:hypothetical protein [Phaeodactylibacter sp.]MCB9299216.1 hypothetical protein [Lewinellaceae bacterium]
MFLREKIVADLFEAASEPGFMGFRLAGKECLNQRNPNRNIPENPINSGSNTASAGMEK